MQRLKVTLLCIISYLSLHNVACAKDTSCTESQKLFSELCFAPKPTKDFDIVWTMANQPKEGWHVETGNDVCRLHMAEVLKGKLLAVDDNFDDMCLRIKIEHSEGAQSKDGHFFDGEFFGFGDMLSLWNCTGSQDFPGVLRCDLSSSGLSKYSDHVNIFYVYSDSINLNIVLQCFPTGEVGWHTLSINPLSDKEKKTTAEFVQSLGFSSDNTVSMTNESCPPV